MVSNCAAAHFDPSGARNRSKCGQNTGETAPGPPWLVAETVASSRNVASAARDATGTTSRRLLSLSRLTYHVRGHLAERSVLVEVGLSLTEAAGWSGGACLERFRPGVLFYNSNNLTKV
eukprot:7053938-Prymnesium_polylepis.1